MASASSSRTETSWPSASIELAIAEPTRPQPTIRTNIPAPLYICVALRIAPGGPSPRPPHAADPPHLRAGRPRACPPRRRRGGEDHLAGRLLDHVAGGLPTKRSRTRPRPPRIAPPRTRDGLLGGEHDRLHAAAARLGHDRLAHGAAAHHRRGHLHPSYSSPTSLARASTRFASLHPLLRHARVDRQRHRDLEHVERLEHRSALALVGVLGGQAARRADDVVVELLAEDRHEDAPVLVSGGLRERLGGIVKRWRRRLALAAAVDHVEHHPRRASRSRR